MPPPPDHAELLRRADYPVPPGGALTDAKMSAQLKPLEAEMARLELLLKDGVRAAGQSFRYKAIRVIYYRPRIKFDNKGLQTYALRNPEVNQFRKVGQPNAYVRYADGDDRSPPADPTGDE